MSAYAANSLELAMAYTNEKLRFIYDKSNGNCACCRKKLAFTNYGSRGGPRGRWEVAHGKSRANGGSDGVSNLWPMCLPCNRGMGTADAARWCGARF